MNSIVINNGLTFTSEPPTKEGWWLHVSEKDHNPTVWAVVEYLGQMWAKNYGGSVVNMGGFWHELIPKQKFNAEVEKAYEEGYDFCESGEDIQPPDWIGWGKSRAKRVIEDKE